MVTRPHTFIPNICKSCSAFDRLRATVSNSQSTGKSTNVSSRNWKTSQFSTLSTFQNAPRRPSLHRTVYRPVVLLGIQPAPSKHRRTEQPIVCVSTLFRLWSF